CSNDPPFANAEANSPISGPISRKFPAHPTVSAQQVDIVVLRALACRQRNGNHVLGLSAIEPIELALPVVGRTEPGAAVRALEICEEHPLVGVAGEELAVPLEA